MAIRSDITVTWDLSPRIITVAEPSTAITMQDLYDTMRDIEPIQIDEEFIISGAGGESLGGGVSVGLTITLNNAKLAFEARTGPEYIQCNITGGNMVAVDENGNSMSSVHPTAFTQIIQANSSSATQTDLEAIQYSSFGGGVNIDVTSPNSGTKYPAGNQEYPVNNIPDAVIIANNNGFTTAFIRTSMTIENVSITDFKLVGASHVSTTIIIADSAVCDGLTIENANVTGILDGRTHIIDCSVGDITYVNGHIHHCGLYGTIVLNGNEDAVVENCFTVNQDSPPIIDMGGSGQDLAMPNYSGIVTIINFDDSNGEIGIGLSSGMVIFDNTILNGFGIISGNGLFVDNSGSNFVVNTDGLINRELITKASWDTVYYNASSTETGTAFPVGTINHPVNNLTDLKTISEANNIFTIQLQSDIILNSSVANYIFLGSKSYIVDLNNQNIADTRFTFCQITGNYSTPGKFDRCRIFDVTNMCGSFKECIFPDNSAITVSSSFSVILIDCATAMTGPSPLILDLVNGSIDIQVKRYSGGIKLINSADGTNIAGLSILGGQVVLDSSCTAGTTYIGGTAGLSDNSGSGFIVDTSSLANSIVIAETLLNTNMSAYNVIGTFGNWIKKILYGSK